MQLKVAVGALGVVLGAALASASGSGCLLGCTALDCESSMAISIESGNGLAEAEHVVTVAHAGGTWRSYCDPSMVDGTESAPCRLEGTTGNSLQTPIYVTHAGFSIAVPLGSLGELPREASVLVELGGEALLDTVVEFDFDTIRPNGEGCEPVCERARVDLEMP